MQVPGTTAVWADFSHIRTVKGRKVCEMIIEAPLEDLLEILTRLGNPVGADSIPVAIAPIDPKAVKAALDVKPAPQASEAGGSSKRKWDELPYSQQAAIRCGEPAFLDFLRAEHPAISSLYSDAASCVRRICNVTSRAELDYELRRSNWKMLEEQYQIWITDLQYAGSKR